MLTFTPVYELLSVDRAGDYLRFLCQLDAESPYMHYRPGERSMTEQGMRSRLKKQEKQGNSFVVVALGLDNSIIGYFSVNGGNSEATRHSATVAVGVLEQYRGQGVAHGLFDVARGWAVGDGVRRFECTVVEENLEAVHFYITHFFRRVGVCKERFMNGGGDLLNEYVFERLL